MTLKGPCVFFLRGFFLFVSCLILILLNALSVFFSVLDSHRVAVETPSGIVCGADGLFSVLGSDLSGFFSGGNVNSYTITELAGDAIPGLYPPPNQGWIVGMTDWIEFVESYCYCLSLICLFV
jgi:hypothetical protein